VVEYRIIGNQKKVQIMARKTLDTTALLRSICALFMLICILFFVFPHAHDCGGNDCPLCVLKNINSEILFCACFFRILPVVAVLAGDFTYFLEQLAPCSLVHLKVKLSD
jgi:hypothetical protein